MTSSQVKYINTLAEGMNLKLSEYITLHVHYNEYFIISTKSLIYNFLLRVQIFSFRKRCNSFNHSDQQEF